MKVTLNWLKDYVDIDMSPYELGDVLTMTGLEVEGIEAAGQSLEDIVVARILSIQPHPDADKLSLCRVDTGKDRVQVVCAAENLEQGALVPLALPGTKLPGGEVIKETMIRGEISTGVLLAEDEMKLTTDHSGVMILPSDLTPGTSLPSLVPVSDYVLDISITPNRPDCASVIGVAREIAAVTGKKLRMPDISIRETGPEIQELARVDVDDSHGCPRYMAGMVQDIQLKPSPFWMRYRLHLCDIRAISNIVDITNYVLLETGQPLHSFDYNRLKENRIVVRRASEGETFTTLDDEDRTLNKDVLVICDGDRGVAIAGIMGGLNSEIFDNTQNVLLESAYFDPVVIRRGSKSLGLSTEASYRYERGVDIGGLETALRRALSLISRHAGGRIARGFIDKYPEPYRSPAIELRTDRTNQILGTSLPRDVIGDYLRSLEMDVKTLDDNRLEVIPRSFRVDISREIDLIEEVARLHGFDNIPITIPKISATNEPETPQLILRDQTRSIMAGLGFSEIITYSFGSPNSADILNADEKSPIRSFVSLLNPLTIDQSVMRTSLIPGLLATVKTNTLHDEKSLKLFEWGKVFIRKDDCQQPHEKTFLATVMTGQYTKKTWYQDARHVDYYDIKGAVEALLKALGLPPSGPEGFVFKKQDSFPWFDPEISSAIYASGYLIGNAGKVSKEVTAAYDLEKDSVYLFELDIETILENFTWARKYRPFARFPAVYRDISLTVNREVESAELIELIRQKGAEKVESVQIFDRYEGDKVDNSEKALGFKVCYRSSLATLDGLEVNRLHESIIDKIMQVTGGKLREG